MIIDTDIHFSSVEYEKLKTLFIEIRTTHYHDGFVNFNDMHSIPIDVLVQFFQKDKPLTIGDYYVEDMVKRYIDNTDLPSIEKLFKTNQIPRKQFVKIVRNYIKEHSFEAILEDEIDDDIIVDAIKKLSMRRQMDILNDYPKYFKSFMTPDEMASALIYKRSSDSSLNFYVIKKAAKLSDQMLIALVLTFDDNTSSDICNEVRDRKLYSSNKVFYYAMKSVASQAYDYESYFHGYKQFLRVAEKRSNICWALRAQQILSPQMFVIFCHVKSSSDSFFWCMKYTNEMWSVYLLVSLRSKRTSK